MCCGMGGYFSLPSSWGGVIAGLKPGQKIVVQKGFGNPGVKEDSPEVVWQVHDLSAITMSGLTLSCIDGQGVMPSDEFDTKARPTWHARKVLFQYTVWYPFARRLFDIPSRISTRWWMTKYRVRNSLRSLTGNKAPKNKPVDVTVDRS